MAIIGSVGVGIPKYELAQNKVKLLTERIFQYSERQFTRLLPVFDHAAILKRQFVVDEEWFLEDHSFQERNNLYQRYSIEHSLEALDACLTNNDYLEKPLDYNAIDMIVFVSSTGVATPSLDVFLMNERPFREDVERMPLWGLGCAGGAIGLSRAFNWLKANPDKTVLLVNCELCSLTFQKNDQKTSNLVGAALFGDGISAVLLIGEASRYRSLLKKAMPVIKSTSSFTKRYSTDVMGWNVSDTGFEVIFSKSIPSLVNTLWKKHMESFLQREAIDKEEVHSFIVHPGGKKVLEAMEDSLSINQSKLKFSYEVLTNHGNMSSATVQYVLQKWLSEEIQVGNKSILSALGPGFSSEILLLEWDE